MEEILFLQDLLLQEQGMEEGAGGNVIAQQEQTLVCRTFGGNLKVLALE